MSYFDDVFEDKLYRSPKRKQRKREVNKDFFERKQESRRKVRKGYVQEDDYSPMYQDFDFPD